jgi:hypothetical protein
VRRIMLALVLFLLACTAGIAGASSAKRHHAAVVHAPRKLASSARLERLSMRIVSLQRSTWRWQRLMGVERTETEGRVLSELSSSDVLGAVKLWQQRAAAAYRRAQNPPHRREWLCIHHYEGSWSDDGAPYYGGLQMDMSFMSRYGGFLLRTKGPANHWTPLEQMWVAERAHRSGLGFYPWPNTARYCGLI